MTDFQMIVLVIMGFCTGSVALNAYFAYIINKIERENEELKVRNQYRIIDKTNN